MKEALLTELTPFFHKPALYTKTEVPFWDDGHISEQMLKAHLDPDFEGASRKHAFIARSLDWIGRVLPPEKYPSILDIGCGPGLYTEGYARRGYAVTGVDFSRRSISYAQASAREKGLQVDYALQNYLNLSLDKTFGLATMIYCDYGALPPEDRARLLGLIYRHLKPGGRLLLDVFSLARFQAYSERQTWEACPKGGFWSPEKHIVLHRACKYPGNVVLEQAMVITGGKTSHYYLWNTHFSRSALEQEAAASGFHTCGCFGDVAGSEYSVESPTLAILLEK